MNLFSSYAHVNRSRVESLIRELENSGYYAIWWDKQLYGGVQWWDEICEAIENCEVFVYMVSPESLESIFCQAEYQYARALNKPILPVLITPTISPADLPAELLKWQAELVQNMDDSAAAQQMSRSLDKLNAKIAAGRYPPQSARRPVMPRTQIDKLRERLRDIHHLNQDGQSQLVFELRNLRDWNHNPKTRRDAENLLKKLLGNRQDITGRTETDIKDILSRKSLIESQTAKSPASGKSDRSSWWVWLIMLAILVVAGGAGIFALMSGDGDEDNDTATPAHTELADKPTNTDVPATTLAPSETATDTPTFTLTATDTPTITFTPTLSPHDIALAGVSSNSEWTPYSETFNGVEMMLVPAGCFDMGSTEEQIEAAYQQCVAEYGSCNREYFEREDPQHEQCFEEPFWIDKYEVSNAQYGSTGCEEYSSEDNQPRNCVSWFEAVDYCESRGARLPAEREWEYAARGVDNLIYPWGNEFDGTQANFCDKNCEYDWKNENYDDGYVNTSPVGSYPQGASWVGALDMSGNVWEWVSSLYDDYPYSVSEREGNHESNSDTNSARVLRGGNFNFDANGLRAAYRLNNAPDTNYDDVGFRCARSY